MVRTRPDVLARWWCHRWP